MSMLKFGHAAVITPVVCPGKWVEKKVPAGRVITAKNIIAKYDPSQWLLSHVTILASVDTEFADPSKPLSNYLIIPEHSIFVNNNGDCWERELLKKCYKTFLGADNWVEHVQIPELSKGKVIDVALREVPVCKGKDGKDITTLYVDILIATNKKHSDLTEKITSGEYNAVSMGTLIKFSVCSQCGNIAEDESKACKHVRFFKNNFFYDKNGVKRIVAELCGHSSDPESNRFIDASWVRKPAFEGALLRNIVQPNDNISEKIKNVVSFPSFEVKPGMNLKAAALKAATELVNEIQAADEPAAAPPTDDSRFSPAPKETANPLKLDAPTEPPPAEAPAEGAPAPEAPPADAPAAEVPADPSLGAPGGAPGVPGAPDDQAAPPVVEPPTNATVKELKDMFKTQIMNELRKELLQEQSQSGVGGASRPVGLENATNSSLIKDASFNRVLASAKKTGNHRLQNGLLILSNLKSWKDFDKYGYTKKDILGMLHFIDKEASKDPVGTDAVKALSYIKIGSNDLKHVFTDMIVEIGRKPTKKEAKKLASWVKILSYLE